MEVYTLDSLLRRERVIDRFESLIWTERYNDVGDFELVIRSSYESRNLLKAGVRLALNESHRVMTIKTVENGVDAEGKAVLTVTGFSLESLLDERVAKESLSDLTTSPKWVIEGEPATVARKIFHDICVTGILNPKDVIPYITETGHSLAPEDTIPEPVDPIKVELVPQSVFQAVRDICTVWNLGFRLLRNFDASQLFFDIYSGSDRTSGQSILDPVIFSPDLDNLQNTRELTTIEGAKNVAYVFSPAGFLEVYPADVDPDIDGFDRQVLMVQADDITDENPEFEAALLQRGREELAKTRVFQAFDGEINQSSQYRYQRDYYLGDIVEMRNIDGVTNKMRITEQIFVSDQEGERSYPTLALNTFVNTGSWLSWMNNLTWADLENNPTTWDEQP